MHGAQALVERPSPPSHTHTHTPTPQGRGMQAVSSNHLLWSPPWAPLAAHRSHAPHAASLHLHACCGVPCPPLAARSEDNLCCASRQQLTVCMQQLYLYSCTASSTIIYELVHCTLLPAVCCVQLYVHFGL